MGGQSSEASLKIVLPVSLRSCKHPNLQIGMPLLRIYPMDWRQRSTERQEQIEYPGQEWRAPIVLSYTAKYYPLLTSYKLLLRNTR